MIDPPSVKLPFAIADRFVIVHPDDPLSKVITAMSQMRAAPTCEIQSKTALSDSRLGESVVALAIVDRQIVGILTEHDCIKHCALGTSFSQTRMREVMSQPVVTLPHTAIESVLGAFQLLQQHAIRHLPVLDDTGHPIGIITPTILEQELQTSSYLQTRLVQDVSHTLPLQTSPHTPLLEVTQLMVQHQASCVVITQPHPAALPQPIGLITEGDFLQLQALEVDLAQVPVERIMSPWLHRIHPRDSLWQAHLALGRLGVPSLLVMDDRQELLGLLNAQSILEGCNLNTLYQTIQTLEARVAYLEAERSAFLDDRGKTLKTLIDQSTLTLRHQAQRERLLFNMAHRIRRSLDLSDILKTTVEEVRQLLNTDRVVIYAFQDHDSCQAVADSLGPVCAVDDAEEETCQCFQLELETLITPLRSPQTQVVHNIYTSSFSPQDIAQLAHLNIHSFVSLPIVVGEQIWGLIFAQQCFQPQPWDPQDVEFLEILAAQVAIAIQQATALTQAHQELAERQRAETALQEKQTQLAMVTTNIPVGIYRVIYHSGGQMTIPYTSEGFQELLGIPSEQLQANPTELLTQYIHPEDLPKLQQTIAELRNQPLKQDSIEYQIITHTGAVKWVRDHARFTWSETGDLIVDGVWIDISDRKVAEASLQKLNHQLHAISEAQLKFIANVDSKTIFDNLLESLLQMTDSVYGFIGEILETPDGRPYIEEAYMKVRGVPYLKAHAMTNIAWNDETRRLYEEQSLQGMEFHNLKTLFGAVILTGQPVIANDPATDPRRGGLPEGHPPLLAFLGIPLRCGDRRVGMIGIANRPGGYSEALIEELQPFLATASNIVEAYRNDRRRRDAEADLYRLNQELEARIEQRTIALRETEARLQILLDNSPAAIYLKDLDGRHLLVNQKLAQILNRPVEACLGKTNPELFEAPVAVCLDDNDRQVLQAKRACRYEEQIYQQDGWHTYMSVKFPLCNSAGDPYAICGISTDITDRQHAEEQLRRSESHLQTIVNNIADGIIILNQHGQIIFTNPSAEKMFLRESQEMCGIQFGVPYSLNEPMIISILRKNEDIGIGEMQAVKVEWDGAPAYILSLRDVTERQRAETALQDSQRFIQQIADTSPHIIYIYDLYRQKNIYVNQSVSLILGYSLETIQQMENPLFAQLVHFEDIRRIQIHQQQFRTAQDSDIFEIEYRMQHANGQWRWLYSRDKVFARDAAGQPTQYIGAAQDITDRKLAELALNQRLERDLLVTAITQRMRESLDLQRVLSTAVEGMQQLLQVDRLLVYRLCDDRRGEIIAEAKSSDCPSVLSHTFGSQVLSEACHQHFLRGEASVVDDSAHSDLHSCIGFLHDLLQAQANLTVPIVQHNKLWGLLIAHQCQDARPWQTWEIELMQQLANQLAVATQQSELYQRLQSELLEREQAQAQLQQTNDQLSIANAELARATRLKDEFLANMSHELRTPLNAILGMTEGLQEGVFGDFNERQLKAMATIEKSGRHLLDLISDILDLAKIESGKLDLVIAPVAIPSLCQSSLLLVRQIAHQKNLKLTVNVPENAGDVEADDRRLRQILINLLSNAVKFTPQGGSVHLEVTIVPATPEGRLPIEVLHHDYSARMLSASIAHLATATSYVLFSVSDTGIGIASDNLHQLFQSFVQIDSSLNRQYAGTGLGLALVKRMADLHHGLVQVETELHRGSCFTLVLPRHQPIAASTLDPQGLLRGKTAVLICEPNEDCNALTEQLNTLEINTITCHYDSDCLRTLRSTQPDLIIILERSLKTLAPEDLQDLQSLAAQRNIPLVTIGQTPPLAHSTVDAISAIKTPHRLSPPVTLTQLQSLLNSLWSQPKRPQPTVLPLPMDDHPQADLPSLASPSHPVRLLLAEDNDGNVDSLLDYLTGRGYEITIARDGQEALGLAQQLQPDIILMDIQMPVMDGLTAIQNIRRVPELAHLPIVALTALAMPGDREKCLAAGATTYLVKPILLKQLSQTLQQLVTATHKPPS